MHTHTVYTRASIQQPHARSSSRALRVYSMLTIRAESFTLPNKHTVQSDVRANARTLLLDLSLTLAHPHTRSHTVLRVNIVDTPSLNLSINILLRPFFVFVFFGRQTMRNDSKWKCAT